MRLHELSQALSSISKVFRGKNEIITPVPGLSIIYSERPMQPFHRVMKPTIWMTIQGTKMTILGDQRFDYHAGQGFVVTVEVPCRCSVAAASPAHPYLGLVLELDRAALQEVMQELDPIPKPLLKRKPHCAFVVDLDYHLLDCALRSVRLAQKPAAISVLFPGIMREICYSLLNTTGREDILHMAMKHDSDQRILRTVRHLRNKFREAVLIEELAAKAGMSAATFHRQFKAATSLSPLQYQKQSRLIEGRRLIMAGNSSVESVAVEVGYISPSQFSREFTRMFGRSPRSEIVARRET